MISFVIPAYNEEALIADCIRSIFEEMGDATYEVIVVDNASTDDTAKVASLMGVTVVCERRKGITRARQTGFENTKFDIVAFIDADSELAPGWLHYALRAINRPGVVAASGPVVYPEMPLHKRIMGFMFYCVARVAHAMLPMVQGGNFLLRREALERVGGFDTEIDFYGEDTSTAVRLSKVGKVRFDLSIITTTSARRMNEEGFFRIGARYITNYLWMWLVGEPWSTEHYDHRAK